MNELLKALYDSFYERLPATQLKDEIERCHRELIEKQSMDERISRREVAENIIKTYK